MNFLLLLLSLFCLPAQAYAVDLTLLVLDNNSYLANQAVAGLDIGVEIEVVTAGELAAGGADLRAGIDRSPVIVVDVMGRELENYLKEKINRSNKTIYALRGSTDDEQLKRLGFIFDDQVAGYYRHISRENIENMLRLVASRHFDANISYAGVREKPQIGIYHPGAGKIFNDVAGYQEWQQGRKDYDGKKPRIGLLFYSSSLTEGRQQPINAIIARLEEEGFNVLPCFGKDQQTIERFLLDQNGRARVDLVLAFSLKFYSALTPELGTLLDKLDVPIINGISLYKDTLAEWRASPVGIAGNEVAWSIATPEISGLIEPTPLAANKKIIDPQSGKTYYLSQLIEENIDRLMGRLHKWLNLQRLANKDKKVAIMFYNHSQGKQNIGASYLNVFASLHEIIRAMADEGYNVGEPPSEKMIKEMILASARNIGSWAPGELARLLQSSQVIRLPVAQYKKWFNELPAGFREKMIKQWGPPEAAKIMRDGHDFIIPAVSLGNLVLLPEPSRGWGDEPMKLYHDTTLYPHHQYLAVYLWLAHGFGADAMVHLGTHATYEWTPGKQAGLSPACPPEVLINDIPNIYPYIVDDVGEGIQAKRRGRAVIISHLIPMLKEVGFYAEYGRMAELVDEYQRARTRNSTTAPEKLKELLALAAETGIMADIATTINGRDDDQQVRLLGHYLEEIRENLMPYGLHTFGRSPGEQEMNEMARAVIKWNPSEKKATITDGLRQSGPDEMAGLLAGLRGRFVPPGEGNDPIRNPGALPTGRNFYGLNPRKLPTPAAWKLGKTAAKEIIENHLNKHKKYPNKVAVVLWATETQRNEGVNESTILYLMGIKPRWTGSGRVVGVEVIPGVRLGRPRIDVMVNASGLYRDLFPGKLEFIDQAVALALRQTDIDNLLQRNSSRLKLKLEARGMAEKEAGELSRLRIFSEQPGSYGTGVAKMASGSGIWEDERQVVDVFENRMGFVFGQGRWGVPARALLKENLAEVDVTVHSRSSNVYGLLDNDDVFQYLGGLSMAVRLESGAAPETLITRQQQPGRVKVEDVARTLGREMRSRYLNPEWIRGMKKQDYAGAREMARFVEYLWGWEMTNPDKVDDAKWQQAYEVYVEDRYGLEMKEFFNSASPWAHQSITGRMLETMRKGYWQPDEKIKQKLAADYAMSVVEKGVACCDHTCNNPLLNQMVVSIISLPGVLSPAMVEKFKIAIEQAARKSLVEQVADRKALQKRLAAPSPEQAGEKPATGQQQGGVRNQGQTEVEGYKMEKMQSRDDSTQVSSSGVEWLAGLVVLCIIGLAAYGAIRKRG
ncbi:MAG: cobaltochelatase subunit CobN [Desulfobacterales bacterium]|nr:cobaltochelatase subunit CobN [Desulfobacterales bacterium]